MEGRDEEAEDDGAGGGRVSDTEASPATNDEGPASPEEGKSLPTSLGEITSTPDSGDTIS